MNVTISELVYLPAPEDNGKLMTCSVTTETIAGGVGLYLKDTRVLDIKRNLFNFLYIVFQIHFIIYFLFFYLDAPIVSLSLGAPLDPNNLMKGSDVYLECDIKANPSVKKVEWFHDVSLLFFKAF